MRVYILAIFAWAILACNKPTQQQNQTEHPQPEVKKKFPWLMGKWVIDYGDTKVYEYWKQQDETMLVGEGFVVAGKDTVVREDMRLQLIGSQWVFIARINDSDPVLFACKQDSAGVKLVFENTEHDYPQNITYGQDAKDGLYAIVSGVEKGKAKREDYQYKKF